MAVDPDRTAADARWMARALDLAERGRWTVSPNPLVGCVLVRAGEVVGEGWHAHAGGDHAEVAALEAAGARARGATAYVTLEPCDHHGRTGPCSRALVEAGVARVVAAVTDPTPEAAGGLTTLHDAGVAVAVGVAEDEARRKNEVFFHGAACGRPFVTLKVATSLDGRIAAADGTSRWLTGAETRLRAHGLRAEADAVLVGSGTVLADDPRLTVRLDGYRGRQPLRVVLDGRGRTRPGHRVHDRSAPTLCVMRPDGDPGTRSVLAAAGVGILTVDTDGPDGGLRRLLDALWQRGVRSVLVEGGATVAGAFAAADLVDRLHLHVAPVLLGDAGRPALAGWPVATLSEARRWVTAGVERVGDDVVLTYAAQRTEGGAALEQAAAAVRTRKAREAQAAAPPHGDQAGTLEVLAADPAGTLQVPWADASHETTDELPTVHEQDT